MRFLLEGKGGEVQKVHFLGPKGPLFWGAAPPPQIDPGYEPDLIAVYW